MHLIYEWEDIFSESMSMNLLDIKRYGKATTKLLKIMNRILDWNHFPKLNRQENHFLFEVMAQWTNSRMNRHNVIPCIVDFHVPSDKISDFFRSYNKCPCILISNLEVFELLQKRGNCPKIYHFPLSLSDKYRYDMDTRYKKDYDLLLSGRQNPVLSHFLDRYKDEEPNFSYVCSKRVNGKLLYFSQDGQCLGDASTREAYINQMRRAKAALYTTPGIDGLESRSQGYNQVTPRFLEMIAAQCHVLARYKKNPDTDFFEIGKFSENLDSYESFKSRMDFARKYPVNFDFYQTFLEKHWTSRRVVQLKDIFNDIGIKEAK
jgi:hypothetical protein